MALEELRERYRLGYQKFFTPHFQWIGRVTHRKTYDERVYGNTPWFRSLYDGIELRYWKTVPSNEFGNHYDWEFAPMHWTNNGVRKFLSMGCLPDPALRHVGPVCSSTALLRHRRDGVLLFRRRRETAASPGDVHIIRPGGGIDVVVLSGRTDYRDDGVDVMISEEKPRSKFFISAEWRPSDRYRKSKYLFELAIMDKPIMHIADLLMLEYTARETAIHAGRHLDGKMYTTDKKYKKPFVPVNPAFKELRSNEMECKICRKNGRFAPIAYEKRPVYTPEYSDDYHSSNSDDESDWCEGY